MAGNGISRREVIRKIGIAGAAAWTAPVLSTVSASAATRRPTCRHSFTCGQNPAFCKHGTCVCTPDVGGKTRCFGCIELDCPSFPTCKKNADCPAGSKCTPGCCDKPVCVPLCGKACPSGGGAPTARRWHLR